MPQRENYTNTGDYSDLRYTEDCRREIEKFLTAVQSFTFNKTTSNHKLQMFAKSTSAGNVVS
jgi:hypothetical protein